MAFYYMALCNGLCKWDHKTVSSDLSSSEQQEEKLLDDNEMMELSKQSLNRIKMRRRYSDISGEDEDSKRRRYKNRGIKF